jgi:multiple sugar transport system substrate-binding protein
MKKKLLVIPLIFALILSLFACSSASTIEQTAEPTTEDTVQSAEAEQKAAEEAAAQAQAELEAVKAAEAEALAAAEKAAAEKAEAERLLAEAKTEEEKQAAEILLAETEAAERAAAQAMAKAEIEKLAAEKAVAEKAATQKAVAAKAAAEKAVSASTNTTKPAEPKTSATPAIDTKPVTLKVWDQFSTPDDQWENLVVAPLKAKYPHITLDRTKPTTAMPLLQAVAGGYKPDVIFTGFYFAAELMLLGLPMELDDYVKKYNVNLNEFQPEAINALRMYGEGKLVGLPIRMNAQVLLYNKDIFDRFGVPYPKDGMTFPQVVELAKKLTRSDGGKQYYGLLPGVPNDHSKQRTIQEINVKTNQANFDNSDMRKIMQYYIDVYNIPGYSFTGIPFINLNGFYKDKNVAMAQDWINGVVRSRSADLTAMNFDMVTLPTWEDRPGIGSRVDAHVMMVSNSSKHKEQSFLVIQHITATKESQINFARTGYLPAVTSSDVTSQFASETAFLKGKNIQAIFKNKVAPLSRYHEYDNLVPTYLHRLVVDVVGNKTDVNTALRNSQEALTKEIKEKMKR